MNAVGRRHWFFTNGVLKSVGIQCALCHSTVDDSFSPGIGQRLDGWPNRDLNVGAIISLYGAFAMSSFILIPESIGRVGLLYGGLVGFFQDHAHL
jgi:hypothetical protein